MPSLTAYDQRLDYSYAPGLFPAMEALLHRPACVRRVLVHSQGQEGVEKLTALAARIGVRVEVADRALSRVSGKENCYAAAVFAKFSDSLSGGKPHVVLHCPSDSGNVGTILRTALGLGVEDVALIRPCVDLFDPRTVRATMGAMFSLRLHVYDHFDAYRADFPSHALFPFMLTGSATLEEALAAPLPEKWTLVFGNEGSGLPDQFSALGQAVRIPSNDRVDSLNLSVAAAIGIYAFTRKGGPGNE
jgi:TrmH family RNA methyltransferase